MSDQTFGQPQPGLTYRHRPGAYLLCIREGQAAIVRTDLGHYLLGGGIEPMEGAMDCLKREILEEVGCGVSGLRYFCCGDFYTTHPAVGPFHPVQFYYLGEVKEKLQEAIEPDHVLEWWPVQEAIRLLRLPVQKWALEQAWLCQQGAKD